MLHMCSHVVNKETSSSLVSDLHVTVEVAHSSKVIYNASQCFPVV